MTVATSHQPAPLTQSEKHVLADCEGIIRRGVATWREVGDALATIRDRRLYRETHATFDAYARDRWDIGRSRAYQLIAAADLATTCEAAGVPPPANESEARRALAPTAAPDRLRRVLPVARAHSPETPESLAERLLRRHDEAFLRTLIARLESRLHTRQETR